MKGLITTILLFFLCQISITATTPYGSYNYDSWEDVVPSPNAYLPLDFMSGEKLGVGNFDQPSDIYISERGDIYILDTNNNRVVVFNNKWIKKEVITTFDNNGTMDSFNLPRGLFVSKEDELYVSDSGNRRIVILDRDRKVKLVIKNPKSETFEKDFDFVPTKIGVDNANRIYAIARGVFEGIMSFDETGDFYGYMGTINVSITPADIIWRKLSTKAQREKQILYIPTEFTSLDLDDEGFVYTTNVNNNSDNTIKRLNPSGDDVLKKPANGHINGDLVFRGFGLYSGPSKFVDLTVRDKGLYTAIESTRGRIFTYDHEGNLLYIFGTVGSQLGTFKKPVAIESIGENLYVLDQERGEIIQFVPSEYGRLINKAVALRYDGDEEMAVDYWREVLKRNANFELAYVGIGKSLLTKGDNKEAMKYLKLGMNQKYYSIAFKRYRNDLLKANLGNIFTGIIILIIAFVGFEIFKSKRIRRQNKNA